MSLKWGKSRILSQGVQKDGYPIVQLYEGRKKKEVVVHRAIAKAFLDAAPGLEVNHIDGDKKNNRLDNLEMCTTQENNAHAWRTGLSKPRPIKLTRDKAEQIRKLLEAGARQPDVAKEFGISPSMVSCIWREKSWKR